MSAEIAGATNDLPETPRPRSVRVPRLTSIARVRREMNRLYGAWLVGQVADRGLGRGIYALAEIRQTLRDDELERCVVRLEACRVDGR